MSNPISLNFNALREVSLAYGGAIITHYISSSRFNTPGESYVSRIVKGVIPIALYSLGLRYLQSAKFTRGLLGRALPLSDLATPALIIGTVKITLYTITKWIAQDRLHAQPNQSSFIRDLWIDYLPRPTLLDVLPELLNTSKNFQPNMKKIVEKCFKDQTEAKMTKLSNEQIKNLFDSLPADTEHQLLVDLLTAFENSKQRIPLASFTPIQVKVLSENKSAEFKNVIDHAETTENEILTMCKLPDIKTNILSLINVERNARVNEALIMQAKKKRLDTLKANPEDEAKKTDFLQNHAELLFYLSEEQLSHVIRKTSEKDLYNHLINPLLFGRFDPQDPEDGTARKAESTDNPLGPKTFDPPETVLKFLYKKFLRRTSVIVSGCESVEAKKKWNEWQKIARDQLPSDAEKSSSSSENDDE